MTGALSLLVGRQEEHPSVKKKLSDEVLGCWHGCLPGVRRK